MQFLKIVLPIFVKKTRRDIIKPESSDDGENHLNLRNWQINQPLFKITNRWMKELNEDELILFYSKAKELMLKLGYEL